MQDRLLLNKYFKLVGGRYLPTPQNPSGQGSLFEDAEMIPYKSSLP